jgi:hypothetical protein
MKAKLALLFIAMALATSCAQGPALVQRPDGSTIATTGARWFTTTTERTASVTLPNGATLTEHVSGEDATKALKVIGNSQLMSRAMNGAGAITKEVTP